MSDIYHMTPTDTCKSGDFRKVTTNGMTAYQCVDTPDIIGQVKEVFTMLGYILGPIIFLTCMYWIYIRKCRRRVHPELVVTTNIPPSNNTIINVENENPQVISNDKKDETKVDETKVEEPKKEEPKVEEKPKNDFKIFEMENKSEENVDKPKLDDKVIIVKPNESPQESPPVSLKVTAYNPPQVLQPRPTFQPRPVLQPIPNFQPRPNFQPYSYYHYQNYGYNPNQIKY